MELEILSEIEDIEVIATGRGVHIRRHLESHPRRGPLRKDEEARSDRAGWRTGQSAGPRSTGSKLMASAERISKSKGYFRESVCDLHQ